MKEIIYLNTNFIHSFIAQTHKGLPTSLVAENLQQDTRTNSDVVTKDSQHEGRVQANTGSLNIPFVGTSPNGNASYKRTVQSNVSESIHLSQIDAGKEIISKQLHDNALYDFEEYLMQNELLKIVEMGLEDRSPYLGEFIKTTSSFKVIDIEYISKITNKEIMKNFFKTFTEADGSNRKKGQIDHSAEQGLKALDLLINYISLILPTKLYLSQDGFISPLKEEYLRESSSELNFKYSSNSRMEVTVLGRATRVFDSFSSDIFSGEFKELSSVILVMTEQIYGQLNILQKGDIVVSPVAIYFE